MSFQISFNAHKQLLEPTDKLGGIWLQIRDRIYYYGVDTVQLLGEVEPRREEVALLRRSVQAEKFTPQVLRVQNADYQREIPILRSRIAAGEDEVGNQKLLDWRIDEIPKNQAIIERFRALAALEDELAPLEKVLRERNAVEERITTIFSEVYGMPLENLAAISHTLETFILIPPERREELYEDETDAFLDTASRGESPLSGITDRFFKFHDCLGRLPAPKRVKRTHSLELVNPSMEEGRVRSGSLGCELPLHWMDDSPPPSAPKVEGKGKGRVLSDGEEGVSSEEEVEGEVLEPAVEAVVLGEVRMEEMFASPELQALVGQVIPLNQAAKIERTAKNTYEITFNRAMRGELSWGDRRDQLIAEAEDLFRKKLQPFEEEIQAKMREHVPEAIVGMLEKLGLTPLNVPRYSYMLEAWKGLDESHWRLNKTIKVEVVDGRFTILSGGFLFGIHVKNMVTALWNILPVALYGVVAPILVQQKVFTNSWGKNYTRMPVHLTLSISGISAKEKGGMLHAMPNVEQHIPFGHEDKQDPIVWGDMKDLDLSEEGEVPISAEGFAFIGKYLEWKLV